MWKVDFPGVTICPNSKIIKSRFRAAMSSSRLPWKNLTQKLEDASAGAGVEFQYSVLEYLTNLAMFSSDPSSVGVLIDFEYFLSFLF